MIATGIHVLWLPNWLPIWPVRSCDELTRVTMAAAAIDSISAGICATSASPIASMI